LLKQRQFSGMRASDPSREGGCAEKRDTLSVSGLVFLLNTRLLRGNRWPWDVRFTGKCRLLLLYTPCTNVNAMLPLQTFYPLPPLTPNELGLLVASHLSRNPHMLLPVLLSLFNSHRRPTSDTTLPNIETEARDTSDEACNSITNGSNVNASTITRTMENGDVTDHSAC
uniref:Mediator of RNA polymerase II transcription subunit 13 n=1 Tax=Hydatigena taeniaeformis TaxID=6205 RepID=A0A0R3WYP2_HYDTA